MKKTDTEITIHTAWAGAGAGLLLGILLKIAQLATGQPVYTLLLTVDYVPGLNRFNWPEWAAFALHLVISAIVGWLWGHICRFMVWRRTAIRMITALFGLFIGTALLPTTYLSELTPHTLNASFVSLWLIAHLLFGLMLGLLLTWKTPKADQPAAG